eukprot:8568676-Alexandrium_andersonii.AAC.1
MSASLVGSEMCIRDRLQAEGVQEVGSGSLEILHEGIGLLLRQAVQEPVSYTHLTLPTICSV